MAQRDTLTTICFQTVDAARRDDAAARFVFDMHGLHARLKPNRVMLGSLELPIVQYSVEERWSRIYFCEGLRVTPGVRSLRILESTDGGAPATGAALLPLHLNSVCRSRSSKRGRVVVKTQHPHGLWHTDGTSMLAGQRWPATQGSGAWLLHAAGGAVFLTAQDVEYVSDHSFSVAPGVAVGMMDSGRSAAGFLHVPGPDSPHALCSTLNSLLQRNGLRCKYSVSFDAATCQTRLAVESLRDAALSFVSVSVEGDGLRSLLGLVAGSALTLPPPLAGSVPGDAAAPSVQLPARLSAETFGGFDYVELPEGWYTPAHRPMGTGQPLRLPSELEGRLNRFTFLPASKEEPLLYLVFRDALARTQAAQIPPGTYNPHSLAKALEDAMNDGAAGGGGVAFAFRFDEGQFRVSCAEEAGGRPVRFDLLFTHPLSVDASRLGFARTDYSGYSEYRSDPVHVPHLEWPRQPLTSAAGTRFPSNSYRIAEEGSTKKLVIGAGAKPTLTGIVRRYDPATSLLTVDTYAAGVPFAHGLQSGDVFALVPLKKASRVLVIGGGLEDATPLPGISSSHGPLLGVASAAEGRGRATRLVAFAPDVGWSMLGEGNAVGIEVFQGPFNLALLSTMPRSVGGRRLGFPERVAQWGLDGRGRALQSYRPGPFVAPHVHDLDHPDYILLFLEEGKQSTGLQHRAGTRVSTPFAKIVLYPLFREERMIPREVTLASGESMTRFTLRFENPDGSPYHFHGAEFSFTLNFVS